MCSPRAGVGILGPPGSNYLPRPINTDSASAKPFIKREPRVTEDNKFIRKNNNMDKN